MKTLFKITMICCTLILMSTSFSYSQSKITLHLTEGSCNADSWWYKVTIIFYPESSSCSGDEEFCYFISNLDVDYLSNPIVITYPEQCNIHDDEYFRVVVEKYDYPGNNELCSGVSSCYQYYGLIDVYVTIN